MFGLSSPTALAKLAAAAAMVLTALAPALANSALPNNKADKPPETMSSAQTAIFAGGCFWGVDAVFKHVKGVSDVESGYAGGGASGANYEQVSGGDTGHAESVRIRFNPAQVSYQQLLQVFFSVAHDPTQLNRQGPDVGSQYRSAIFYTSADQQKMASAYIQQITDAHTFSKPVVTQVVPLPYSSSIELRSITRITWHCILTSPISFSTTCPSWRIYANSFQSCTSSRNFKKSACSARLDGPRFPAL